MSVVERDPVRLEKYTMVKREYLERSRKEADISALARTSFHRRNKISSPKSFAVSFAGSNKGKIIAAGYRLDDTCPRPSSGCCKTNRQHHTRKRFSPWSSINCDLVQGRSKFGGYGGSQQNLIAFKIFIISP